jgi:PPK2 family polyphosphate:nucleotide phosphotransferase
MADQPDMAALRKRTLIRPEEASEFRLKDIATSDAGLYPDKDEADRSLRTDADRIAALQEALFAERQRALLVIIQGVDAAGKDGVTRAVFAGVSPLGLRAHAFSRPTEAELRQDYLWRVHSRVPASGMIAVFNRSHYEDVLAVRVRGLRPPSEIEKRYRQINMFEQHLVENGVRILKLMLHISRSEQAERLRERARNPRKRWKLEAADIADRQQWDAYQDAYETAIRRCSSTFAPWHVVPSDSKARRNAIVARLVLAELEDMAPRFPDIRHDGLTIPD